MEKRKRRKIFFLKFLFLFDKVFRLCYNIRAVRQKIIPCGAVRAGSCHADGKVRGIEEQNTEV